MAIGDVDHKITIGGIDFSDPSKISFLQAEYHEDMLNKYGHVGSVKVADYQDVLGNANITGKEDVTVNFSLVDGSDPVEFTLGLYKNNNFALFYLLAYLIMLIFYQLVCH